ncbi:Sodium/potassium-transporting ATPase subunit beta-3 [Microtus ochrogaster]|uniref:Sodium/potassium-transporting ATPase subunit beta-3 n=1 Tax=Microtus ochrogaster TaxID=79684 RepID=A0A8J6FYL6_MICOH|nr:Sodium/potassium-transporting ATPase subunit beta-3 [Microtus ochrogaster]
MPAGFFETTQAFLKPHPLEEQKHLTACPEEALFVKKGPACQLPVSFQECGGVQDTVWRSPEDNLVKTNRIIALKPQGEPKKS